MKNIPVLLGAAMIALASCTQKENTTVKTTTSSENTAQVKTIDSLMVNDSVRVSDKVTMQFRAKMLYFPEIKDKALQDSIYLTFADQLNGFSFAASAPQKTSPFGEYNRETLQSFLKQTQQEYFDQTKKELQGMQSPSFAQTWYNSNKMEVKYHENGYLAIEYSADAYTGGAHGNYFFTEKTFDLENNKRMLLTDITAMPEEKISELLIKNLDKGTESKNYTRKDMLLVDKIPVTTNFYFDRNNLYFHYSPYEIAAYAAGDILIPISWPELKGTLNADFAKRMQIGHN